jgi:hypothetical protein
MTEYTTSTARSANITKRRIVVEEPSVGFVMSCVAIYNLSRYNAWEMRPQRRRDKQMSKSGFGQPLPHPLRHQSIGRCIYCGATEDLTDEHVIPYALNGPFKLDNASCKSCSEITSAFEGRVVGQMLGPARHVLRMRTRRRKKRKATYTMLFRKHGRDVKKEVSVDDYLGVIPAPFFGYPEHLAERFRASGVTVPTGVLTVGAVAFQRQDAVPPGELVKRHRAKKLSSQTGFEWKDYARLLAKIGHGYIVAKYGLESIAESYVVNCILGRTDDALRWVGCQGLNRQLPVHSNVPAIYHNIGIDVQNGELISWIRLFDNFENAPEYLVIVGRATDGLRALLRGLGNRLA